MRTVDLFSGCGGMSLGFQNEGFEIAAAFDNWAPAVRVYKDNFNHPIYDLDVTTQESLALIQKIEPEMIVGGPP